VHTQPKEIRRLVGYMPDFFGVYDDMTVTEYLEFFAAAYRINGVARRKRVDEMLDVVDLDFKRDAYANTLSRGQTQRLGLARTLMHDPQVLLLDEPLSGLDPRARIEMRNLLRRLGELGKTIIVSSHILPELADVCNKVGIIDRGELKQNAKVSEVIRMVREHTVLVVQPADRGDLERIRELLSTNDKVQGTELGDDSVRVVLKPEVEDYTDIPELLISRGVRLRQFTEEQLDLESAFMALTKGTSRRM
jgi:ABC-2 type transport system ATP-binding protein